MGGFSKAIEVDPARRSEWLIPSAVRALDPEHVGWLLPLHAAEGWEAGDLFLVRVEVWTRTSQLESVRP